MRRRHDSTIQVEINKEHIDNPSETPAASVKIQFLQPDSSK